MPKHVSTITMGARAITQSEDSPEIRAALFLCKLLRIPVEPTQAVDTDLLRRCESETPYMWRYLPLLAACLVLAVLGNFLIVPLVFEAYVAPLIGPIFNLIADAAVAVGLGARNGAAVATPLTRTLVILIACLFATVPLVPFWLLYRRVRVACSPLITLAIALERDGNFQLCWDDYPRSRRAVRIVLSKRTFSRVTSEVLTSDSS